MVIFCLNVPKVIRRFKGISSFSKNQDHHIHQSLYIIIKPPTEEFSSFGYVIQRSLLQTSESLIKM